MSKNATTELKYDCRVFICQYNREPVRNRIYDKIYYEINNGLQQVTVNLNREGMGSATINLFLPLQDPFVKEVLIAYDRETILETTVITLQDYLNKKEEIEKKHSVKKAKEILDATFRGIKNTNTTTEYINISSATKDNLSNKVDKVEMISEVGGNWGIITDKAINSAVEVLKRNKLFNDKAGKKIQTSYYPILNEDLNECIFRPMDKIKIYMSNRFQGKSIDDEHIKTISTYSQVFEGLINNINLNYNNGSITLTISAKDITRWLDLSQFNVNPAIASNILDSIFVNLGVRPFDTAFANKSLSTILEILITGYQNKWMKIPKDDYLRAYTKMVADKKEADFGASYKIDVVKQDVTDWDTTYKEIINETIFNLEVKLKENGKTLNQSLLDEYKEITNTKQNLTFKDIDVIITGENLISVRDDIVASEAKIKQVSQFNTIEESVVEYYTLAPPNQGAGNFRLLKKNQGLRPGVSKTIDNIRLETDFTADKLWIDPNIEKFVPYRSIFNNFELYQHNWKKRLEIIKEICAINEFEFFMDSTGILVCKVPDYNLNPGTVIAGTPDSKNDGKFQDANSSAYFKMNNDKFLIKPNEIISYNKSTSDDNIVTYCIMVGDYKFDITEAAKVNTNIAFDTELAKNFGVRIITKAMPLLSGNNKSTARELFAQAWLNRHNSKYRNINMSIPLRPELQLAKTVAILPNIDRVESIREDINDFNRYILILYYKKFGTLPSNSEKQASIIDNILNRTEVGYISQIIHMWTPGQVCTTKLTLSHMRLWTQDFGILGYTRSNIELQKTSLDYQKLESQVQTKIDAQESSYKRYQTALTKAGYDTKGADGKIGDNTRKAVNSFIDDYNQKYNDNIAKITSDEDPFEDTLVLEAMIKDGIL